MFGDCRPVYCVFLILLVNMTFNVAVLSANIIYYLHQYSRVFVGRKLLRFVGCFYKFFSDAVLISCYLTRRFIRVSDTPHFMHIASEFSSLVLS
jgi:hypothetical protein